MRTRLTTQLGLGQRLPQQPQPWRTPDRAAEMVEHGRCRADDPPAAISGVCGQLLARSRQGRLITDACITRLVCKEHRQVSLTAAPDHSRPPGLRALLTDAGHSAADFRCLRRPRRIGVRLRTRSMRTEPTVGWQLPC